jgi:hypothetical protein
MSVYMYVILLVHVLFTASVLYFFIALFYCPPFVCLLLVQFTVLLFPIPHLQRLSTRVSFGHGLTQPCLCFLSEACTFPFLILIPSQVYSYVSER